jgi:hypothetical protein
MESGSMSLVVLSSCGVALMNETWETRTKGRRYRGPPNTAKLTLPKSCSTIDVINPFRTEFTLIRMRKMSPEKQCWIGP